MLKKSTLLILVLTLSSWALAQKTQLIQMPPEAVRSQSTTACDVTYSSGTSITQTKFCVTANGNITQFSVATQEMIDVGAILEGYGFCDENSGTAYYDWADFDSGNWQAATFKHSGNVITVTRETTDGIWQLTQTITNVAASSTGFGSAKVAMKLKNLSGVSRSAVLYRYADVDATGTTTNDFDNTGTSTYGLVSFQHGLSLTNNTFNINYGYLTFIQNTPAPPNVCGPSAATGPFVGDGSIAALWSFTLGHGGTGSVVATYKGI